MRERLIQLVSERAGLDQAKATQAVDTILGYIKDNPGELKNLVGGDIGAKLGGVLGH